MNKRKKPFLSPRRCTFYIVILLLMTSSCSTHRTRILSNVEVKDDSGKIEDEGKYIYENNVKVSKFLSYSCALTFWAWGGTCWGYQMLPTHSQRAEIRKKAHETLDKKFGQNKWSLRDENIVSAESILEKESRTIKAQIEKESFKNEGYLVEENGSELFILATKKMKQKNQLKTANEKKEKALTGCKSGNLESCYDAGLILGNEGNKEDSFKYLSKYCSVFTPEKDNNKYNSSYDRIVARKDLDAYNSRAAIDSIKKCFIASAEMKASGIDEERSKIPIQKACTTSIKNNINFKKYLSKIYANHLVLSNPCFVLENWNNELNNCGCNIITRNEQIQGAQIQVLSSPDEKSDLTVKRATAYYNNMCKEQGWMFKGIRNCRDNKCEMCLKSGRIKDNLHIIVRDHF